MIKSRTATRVHTAEEKVVDRFDAANASPGWAAENPLAFKKALGPDPDCLPQPAMAVGLRSWGLTRRRQARVRKGGTILRPPLQEARHPNEVWTVDFKGWFRHGGWRQSGTLDRAGFSQSPTFLDSV